MRAGQVKGDSINQTFGAVRKGLNVVEEHMALNETTKLAADMAKTQAELTEQWRQTIANGDPNDPDLAEKFQNEVVKPRLDELGDGLFTMQSKNMFEKASASMFGDFYVRTAADQAELSATAAAQNVVSMTNDLSMSVRQDPVGWQNSVALANAAIDGMTQIPMQARLKMKTAVGASVAESAILGMAKENPQAAIDAINSGEFKDFVPADKAEQYIAHANALQNANDANEKEQVRRAEKERKDISEAAHTDVVRNIYTGGDITGWQQNELLDASQLENIANTLAKGPTTIDDPATVTNFRQNILSGQPVTSMDINQAVNDGKMKWETADNMIKLLSGKKEASWGMVKSNMDRIFALAKVKFVEKTDMGGEDPDGMENYTNWSNGLMSLYYNRVEAGDRPEELMDPNSDRYILKMYPITALSTAAKSEAQQAEMTDTLTQLKARREAMKRGEAVPDPTPQPTARPRDNTRQPGETIEDYETRRQAGRAKTPTETAPEEAPTPEDAAPTTTTGEATSFSRDTGSGATSFSLRRPAQTSGVVRDDSGRIDMTQFSRDPPLYKAAGVTPEEYGTLRDMRFTHEQIMAMTLDQRRAQAKGE